MGRNVIAAPKAEELGAEAIAWVNRFSPYAVLARIVMPNYLKASQTVARNQTMASQALLVCALQRYRLAHDEYPEKPEKLAPEWIQNLPHDLCNGQPMKYRRLDKDHFLLYCVGWNETDEGGTPGKTVTEGDWVWEGA
jgi:hypothetical protein